MYKVSNKYRWLGINTDVKNRYKDLDIVLRIKARDVAIPILPIPIPFAIGWHWSVLVVCQENSNPKISRNQL
jgi:hypothetical protein